MKTFKHDCTFMWGGTGEIGQILPAGQMEILPNDIFQIQTNGVVKFGTLEKPLMHRLKAKLVCTFTPIRRVLDTDDHWEDFITGGQDGNDATTLDTNSSSVTANTIDDYLGVKPVAGTNNLLAYPRRCYNAFFNEYILDEQIQGASPVAEDNNTIKYVNWGKDYFTTARPSAQLGTAVSISIGGTAPITNAWASGNTYTTDPTAYKVDGSAPASADIESIYAKEDPNNLGYPRLDADLSSATGMDPNDFDLAMAANRYMQRVQRTGSRLTEFVKYLGGNIGDRLERPEIVSISSANVSVSEVFNTNALATNLGDQAGFALAGLDGRRAVKWFPEHGYLTWFFWVIPENIYMDGCPRYMMRTDKEDFYTPEYANVMMQPIKKGEIYFQGTSVDAETWAYTDNYRDYKEGRNIFTSGFRADYDDEHLGRQFSSLPALNNAFLTTESTIRNADVFSQTATHNVRLILRHQVRGRRIVVPKTNFTFTRIS